MELKRSIHEWDDFGITQQDHRTDGSALRLEVYEADGPEEGADDDAPDVTYWTAQLVDLAEMRRVAEHDETEAIGAGQLANAEAKTQREAYIAGARLALTELGSRLAALNEEIAAWYAFLAEQETP